MRLPVDSRVAQETRPRNPDADAARNPLLMLFLRGPIFYCCAAMV